MTIVRARAAHRVRIIGDDLMRADKKKPLDKDHSGLGLLTDWCDTQANVQKFWCRHATMKSEATLSWSRSLGTLAVGSFHNHAFVGSVALSGSLPR